MLKRKSQTFFIVVVAIAAIFTSTGALAEVEVKEIVIGGCGFTAEGPIVVNEESVKFVYTITGDCSKSQFALALPDPGTYCEDDLWWNKECNECKYVWPDAGLGDSDTKWYEFDYSVRVIEITEEISSFSIVTTANVAAHPTPLLLKKGNKLYYGTTMGPSCTPPPPPPAPVAVSAVSTTTPEGCTLKVEQTLTGPVAMYKCPDDSDWVQANDYDIDEVYLGFPTDGVCKDGLEVEVTDDITICLQAFKFLSDQAFGRVGQESTGWYFWNGKWYSYTY